MADTISTNQFKNGMHIELDGGVWRIVEFQHVKPGKGGAFVRTKVKSVDTGAVVDKTFRAGEKFERVYTETKSVQFLYDDGSDVHFMDEETYEQFALPHAELAGALPYMQPSSSVQMLVVGGKPSGLQLPASVELAVTQTEPGVKGDTVSNVTKPATLETGAVVQGPLFVNEAGRIMAAPRGGRNVPRTSDGRGHAMKRPPRGSTLMRSPTFTKRGTCTTAPVSRVAGFVTFETVSPFTPGSVWVTPSSTDPGSCTPEGLPPTNRSCTEDDGWRYGSSSSTVACGRCICSYVSSSMNTTSSPAS